MVLILRALRAVNRALELVTAVWASAIVAVMVSALTLSAVTRYVSGTGYDWFIELPPGTGSMAGFSAAGTVIAIRRTHTGRLSSKVIAPPLMGIGITELPARHILMASSAFIPWILAVAVTEQMSA